MVLSDKDKQAALRQRKASAGLKELRNIWVTDKEKSILKPKITTILNAIRNK